MELTQKQWKEFQEFKEEYAENELTRNLLLQHQNDLLKGGLCSANLAEYRNTYVINAQDSLDATYPMYVHFNIISEMTKIVSIKLSFWFLNFRAYSKAGAAAGTPSGGGSTSGATGSASGGGSTTPSGGTCTTPSGGTCTSSANNDETGLIAGGNIGETPINALLYNVQVRQSDGFPFTDKVNQGTAERYKVDHFHSLGNHAHLVPNHTHIVPNHTHATPDHTHPNHTHTTPAHTHPNHTHGAVYGIFEEETSPTVMVYISRDNGLTYSLPLGSYTKDQSLDITRFIDNAGSKMIKFTSNARTRLSVQITIKLDIRAR